MAGYKKTGNKEGVDNPDETLMGLTRFSSVGQLVQRVGRRIDLVTRLLQEESTPDGLTAEHISLPAGTLRKFGGVECAWCPPGQFMMGSPESEEGRRLDEIQHLVTLTKGFWMRCCPVIQTDYQAMVGCNPSVLPGIHRPVEMVSWDEAVEYCRKLTLKQREEGTLPDGWEWRLPTEAEWEYAARAGTETAYHTGMNTQTGCNDDPNLNVAGWYCGNAANTTHSVGQRQVNAWGLYDMHGNVWEWVQDWYAAYPAGDGVDPTGPAAGTDRVFRGGAWSNHAQDARSAVRGYVTPGARYDGIVGFRPARSLP